MAVKTFRDLLVWQEAYKLAMAVYKITAYFPKNEQYGLTNQLRRAVISVSSNIAEGFGRSGAREKDQFYAIANGSLTEVENQLLIAHGIGYLPKSELAELENIYTATQKMLAGLQKANRKKE